MNLIQTGLNPKSFMTFRIKPENDDQDNGTLEMFFYKEGEIETVYHIDEVLSDINTLLNINTTDDNVIRYSNEFINRREKRKMVKFNTIVVKINVSNITEIIDHIKDISSNVSEPIINEETINEKIDNIPLMVKLFKNDELVNNIKFNSYLFGVTHF